jgi:outer membrane protein TolC
MRRQEERVGAILDYRVASTELARLLRLDPQVTLLPVEDFRYPMTLPGEEWDRKSLEDLVAFALSNRPELAENRALVQAALERVRTAQFRPLLPNLVVNYSWGDFGGSPDLNPPIITPPVKKGDPPKVTSVPGFGPSGRIEHFNTRSDFDATILWRLQNFGLGNRAEVREQQALHRQAQFRRLQAQDRVIAQVIQSRQLIEGWRERVRLTQNALFDEKGAPRGPVFRSLRLDFERIQGAEGRPLEALDSIRRLSDLLDAYGQAVTDYERSRFRLLIALGMPPQALIDFQAQAGEPERGAPNP